MKIDLRIWALFLLITGVSTQNTSVSVSCGSSHLTIAVPVALFGSGVVVDADELTLGTGCAVTAVHTNVLLLEYPLFACGATRKILPDSIHYRNILHYVPSAANGVIRSSGFSHPIDCFYPRSWNVSSLGLKPTWVPFTSTVVDRQRLDFALEVYDSSWSLPMPDPVYYLGDQINIQASVKKGSHVPLKVYVDECVARPSAESSVKYEVITNHGCFVDGQQSSSRFLATRVDGILRFQLDTFTFTGVSNNQIYLICHLKAVSTSATNHLNKACSYDRSTATWSSHEGADCSCCASRSGCNGRRRRRRKRGHHEKKGLFGETDIKLGPIELKTEQVNSSMLNASSTSEHDPFVATSVTSKTPRDARISANQVVNIIMREGVKEDSSGINLPFSTATLVIIVASLVIVLVSVLGCYCSSKRSHRGYHMGAARAPLGQPGAVPMAPAAVGSSGSAVSGESSTASKKPDGASLQ
ncbi:oocyte-secreted protein 3 [Anolis carolinensis]|uniref:Zona pellucida sperm-binding protein 3 n=1 Tax=Anolis carolinensis TaxID=28377 RepID=A0A803SQV0_ANOCA|nr:PREDICTED: zona pellucida sperm-binding protein 3 [Anolis carolinensis]|eukprot:XP_008108877.1 PREDICTED: zona pellucida sperm-binding protein 3 [Anolis carolinensis]